MSRPGWQVLAALVVVTAASPGDRPGRHVVHAVPSGVGVFRLPRPLNWWWTAAVVATTVVVPVVIDPSWGWAFLTFIVVAVAIGTGAGRMMSDQGADHARMRDELTITAERDRVARDVHDVLGHSLTVVSVKAELAQRLIDLDPERARTEAPRSRPSPAKRSPRSGRRSAVCERLASTTRWRQRPWHCRRPESRPTSGRLHCPRSASTHRGGLGAARGGDQRGPPFRCAAPAPSRSASILPAESFSTTAAASATRLPATVCRACASGSRRRAPGSGCGAPAGGGTAVEVQW